MIIVFDGVCNFCNGWARFVLRQDRIGRFQFAAAQSKYGARILQELGYSGDDLATILLIEDGRHYEKSDAILRILGHLGGLWSFSRICRIVPKRVRDAGYSAFARRRYAWFGK